MTEGLGRIGHSRLRSTRRVLRITSTPHSYVLKPTGKSPSALNNTAFPFISAKVFNQPFFGQVIEKQRTLSAGAFDVRRGIRLAVLPIRRAGVLFTLCLHPLKLP